MIFLKIQFFSCLFSCLVWFFKIQFFSIGYTYTYTRSTRIIHKHIHSHKNVIHNVIHRFIHISTELSTTCRKVIHNFIIKYQKHSNKFFKNFSQAPYIKNHVLKNHIPTFQKSYQSQIVHCTKWEKFIPSKTLS